MDALHVNLAVNPGGIHIAVWGSLTKAFRRTGRRVATHIRVTDSLSSALRCAPQPVFIRRVSRN